VFQAVGLELTLNELKDYSRRKPLDLKCKELFFADRTATEDLTDRTAQKQ